MMTRFIVAGLAGLLAATVARVAVAEQFSAAHYLPPTHPLAIAGYDQWAKEIEKLTNGEVTFEIFGGGSLYPAQAALKATADSLAQVGFMVANYTPSELPVAASLGDAGFAHPDPRVLTAAMTDFMINDPQAYAEWRKGGVVATTGYSTPEYYFICAKPVRKVEDFRGLKIRTPTSGFSRLVESFGAVPVSIPSNEIYTAFDRGALDCTTGDASFLTGSVQILEVVHSMTLLQMTPSYTGALHGYDEEFWQQLTDDQRRAILTAEARTIARSQILYSAEAEKGMQAARDAKLEMVEPSEDMKAALAKFVEDNVEAQVNAARDLGVENPEDLLKRFDEYLVKWEGLIATLPSSDDEEAFTKLLMENIYDKIDVTKFGME
jgi:TRAP-type C4-dicarboxylate transport system substrate-binding protein